MEGNTVREMAARGMERLRRAGAESPRLDAELLLAMVLGKDRHFLYMNPHYRPGGRTEEDYAVLLDRRAGGEPLQYLTGVQEFMGLRFAVDPSVLIPRPDTETLVETVLDRLKGCCGAGVTGQNTAAKGAVAEAAGQGCGGGETFGLGMNSGTINALDLGTGSGAIAISLAYYCRRLAIKAVDISPGALRIAQKNAARHRVADRIEFLGGDLFSPFEGTGQKFDIIVSNPPYISGEEMRRLPREVLHEPQSALYGGSDGLCFYRRIAADAPGFLRKGGLLAVEVGYHQAAEVMDLLDQTGAYTGMEVVKDLAGRDRVVTVYNVRGE
ncbi:MAG: peptide chain release factor N(5)-glutamine methyltransferase [Clostridia bacterium]|jgi:release factor glutamine methyltransferase